MIIFLMIVEKFLKDFNLRFNIIWLRYIFDRIDCKERFFKFLDLLMFLLFTLFRISGGSEMYCL